MRTKSCYETECLCGEKLVSESNVMTCPKCGRVIEIQWGKVEQ
jgi:Fe2+ or Zn2+ uptake regulation protein